MTYGYDDVTFTALTTGTTETQINTATSLSAGRVQSATLKIIIDKETDIQNKKPASLCITIPRPIGKFAESTRKK